jgi:hypothetical protein
MAALSSPLPPTTMANFRSSLPLFRMRPQACPDLLVNMDGPVVRRHVTSKPEIDSRGEIGHFSTFNKFKQHGELLWLSSTYVE